MNLSNYSPRIKDLVVKITNSKKIDSVHIKTFSTYSLNAQLYNNIESTYTYLNDDYKSLHEDFYKYIENLLTKEPRSNDVDIVLTIALPMLFAQFLYTYYEDLMNKLSSEMLLSFHSSAQSLTNNNSTHKYHN
ncbi:hypothetical protein PMIT1342_01872 [Prochlorococcus marinus str. MIT 1342]|nr:hypothetical protein PMIT1342_01872 [Prochlorococcus marinus str. MIT 1342]